MSQKNNKESLLGIGIVLIVLGFSLVSLSIFQSYSNLKYLQSSTDSVDEFGRGFEQNRYIFAKDCHEEGGSIIIDYKAGTMECVL